MRSTISRCRFWSSVFKNHFVQKTCDVFGESEVDLAGGLQTRRPFSHFLFPPLSSLLIWWSCENFETGKRRCVLVFQSSSMSTTTPTPTLEREKMQPHVHLVQPSQNPTQNKKGQVRTFFSFLLPCQWWRRRRRRRRRRQCRRPQTFARIGPRPRKRSLFFVGKRPERPKWLCSNLGLKARALIADPTQIRPWLKKKFSTWKPFWRKLT